MLATHYFNSFMLRKNMVQRHRYFIFLLIPNYEIFENFLIYKKRFFLKFGEICAVGYVQKAFDYKNRILLKLILKNSSFKILDLKEIKFKNLCYLKLLLPFLYKIIKKHVLLDDLLNYSSCRGFHITKINNLKS